jgi:CHASE2 domain-containing sensor protein
MKKKVILTLAGSYEQGMSANLRILEESVSSLRETLRVVGQLPPAGNLSELFSRWQVSYRRQISAPLRMKFINAQVTQVSCEELSTELCFEFNKWLNSKHEKWQKIRDRLQQNLSKTDEIVLIIETEDRQVQQLPWHLWKLITDDYPQAEVALSTPDYQLPTVTSSATNKVKILAVLGNAEGIDVQSDRTTLESLPDTEVCFLVEPKHQELTEQLWRSQGWDILFFAGHSVSRIDGSAGVIYLNQNEQPLTISQLKYALLKAIQKGLKLAIFNSCDGLGIARDLAELNIPQMIVMREPVPDLVAQEFSKYFLQYFAIGESFYLAVRLAREKLQGLEVQFPCASWLPVIFQNSVQMPLSWHSLRDGRHQHLIPASRQRWQKVLLTSILATSLIMGARYLGVLQPLELQAFDHLIRLRPDEQRDSRLLVVAVSDEDFRLPVQQHRIGSLSDIALAQLLDKLLQFKPRAIGLDIYRDFSASNQGNLVTQMRSAHNFYAICKARDVAASHPGVAPPPEVPVERQGFSDIVKDSDGVLRRYLLAMKPIPSSPCATSYALSALLAFHYLAAEGIFPKYTQAGDLQLGKVTFKRLRAPASGYQILDTWDYQILLNYRSYRRSPSEIVPIVTLADVLSGSVRLNDVKDRIVLIGVTARSVHDYLSTPYSTDKVYYRETPGVIIQAQMVSQLLSTVLDGRPAISVWSAWSEGFWIWGWSLVGGIIAYYCYSRLFKVLAGGIALGSLYLLCFVLLVQGSWVPLIPSVLALIFAGCGVAVCLPKSNQQQYKPVASGQEHYEIITSKD